MIVRPPLGYHESTGLRWVGGSLSRYLNVLVRARCNLDTWNLLPLGVGVIFRTALALSVSVAVVVVVAEVEAAAALSAVSSSRAFSLATLA